MKRFATRLAACAGLVLFAACPSRAGSTVKYEFTRDSSSVTLTSGNLNFCGAGTFLNGTVSVHFNDVAIAGATVTFQAGFQCLSGSPATLQVNGTAFGNFGVVTANCCGGVFQVANATITTTYNNGISAKTINLTSNPGSLMPLTGLFNTTDPMFRISVTMIPGPGPGSSTGTFTNVINPTMVWPAMPAAGMYQLQISADPFFASPLVDASAIPSNSFALGSVLVNGNTYYARVRTNAGPYNGAWSYITDFTVAQTAPSTPVLVSPANPSNVPVQTPTFNWNPVTLGTE